MFNSAHPTSGPVRPSYRAAVVVVLILTLLMAGNIGPSRYWLAAPATARADSPTPVYTLYGWGYNNYGQLGNGTTTNSATPAVVSLPAGVGPVQVAAGQFHSLAIGSDGNLYAWGNNQTGQLGNGSTTNTSTPVAVRLPAGVSPVQVAANYAHSLAIGSDNKLYGWGFNRFGQLGNGTTTDSPTPVAISLPAGVTPRQVAAGYFHSLAIGSDNKLYAWGLNGDGELGNGTTTNSAIPVMVNLPAGVTPTQVAAGQGQSLAIGSDGNLYAWGYNASGQLGNGTTTTNPTTTPVVVNLPAGVTPAGIAGGSTYSLAIGSNGNLYAWGDNQTGQLGNGTTTQSNIPVVVGSVAGVANPLVAAGGYHTLALLSIPTQITATGGSPQSAAVGTDFASPLVATVRDSANNPVSSLVVTFTAPAGGATGTFTGGSPVYTGTTDASGTVTATTFTANTITGSYSVTVSVSGVITPATFSLTNLPGPAASINAIGGAQSAPVISFFASPLVVIVTDQYNNPISGTVVTFNPPASGPSAIFFQSTATTGANGVATSSLFVANTIAGSYNVTATVSGVITPASFALTNLPGPASALSLVSGDNQQTVANTTFGSPLVAKVTDNYGNAVSGAEVDFAAPTSGASATFAGSPTYTTTTDVAGLITSTTPAANPLAGSYSVTATVILPTRTGVRARMVGPRTTVVQYHLTNLTGCNPLYVTSTGDDGSCGTLRAALVAASAGPTKTVSIQLTAGSVITLTTGLTLTSGVSITTTAPCGTGMGNTMLPPVIIQGAGANSGVGLTLSGNNQLYGLWLRGFSGVQIKAPVGSHTTMQCVKASKS